jgi:hypothetical protein
VWGNERADKQANTAGIGSVALQWGDNDVLHQLKSESRIQIEDSSNHHLFRLRNRGIQLGSGKSLML